MNFGFILKVEMIFFFSLDELDSKRDRNRKVKDDTQILGLM